MRLRNSFIVVFLLWSFGFAAAPAEKPVVDANNPAVFGAIFNLIPKELADQITPTVKGWTVVKSDLTKANKLAADIKKAIVGKSVVVPCTIDIRKQGNGLYYVAVEAIGTAPGISLRFSGTLRITEQDIPAWIRTAQNNPTMTATITDKVLVGFEVVMDKKTKNRFLAFGISQRGNNWDELKFSVNLR
jgi:hypothetical protein